MSANDTDLFLVNNKDLFDTIQMDNEQLQKAIITSVT